MGEMSNDWVGVLARQMGPRLRSEFEREVSPAATRDIAECLDRLRRAEGRIRADKEKAPRPE